MTLLEYVQSLQDQGATDIPDKVQEWKKKNQPKVEEEVIKTPAEEVKINDAADQTGATVTSTPNASESSSSGSGELVSQEPRFFGSGMTDEEMDQARKSQKKYKEFTAVAQPGESISANEFDYKYDLNDKGKGVYSYKPEGSEEWKQYEAGSTGEAAIASEFGHSDFDKEKFFKQQQEQKQVSEDFNIGNSLEITSDEIWMANVEEQKIKVSLSSGYDYRKRQNSLKNASERDLSNPSLKDYWDEVRAETKLPLDLNIYNAIEEDELNVLERYEEFSDLETDAEDPGQGIRLIEADFNLNNVGLKESGFNTNDFLGFMNSKGYTKDYTNNLLDEDAYGQMGKFDITPEQSTTGEVKRQRDLDNYLSLYIAEKTDRYNNSLYLSYIRKNRDKFKTTDSLSEAILKAKKYFKKEHGQSTFFPFDSKKLKAYRDDLFPELVAAEKNEIAIGDIKRAKIRTQGTAEGLLVLGEDSTRKAHQAFWGQAEDQAIELGNLLGYEMGLASNLNAERDIKRSASDVRYGYVEGKEAEVDGITYIKDEDGGIYDATNKTTLGSVDEEEYAKIDTALENSKKTGSSFSGAGTTEQFAATAGSMAYDIAQVYGVGKFTKVAQLGKLAKLIRMPKASLDAMAYYTVSGYVSTKKNTYNQLINAGVNVDDATELSEEAGRLGGLLYGTTSLFAPTTKYMKVFGEANLLKKTLNKAVMGYKSGGKGTFTKNLVDGIRKLTPANIKDAVIKTGGAGGQEFVQEETQSGLETLGLNAYINKKAGSKILDEDFTRQDFINTGVLSFGAGGVFSNLSIPGFKPNAKQQLQSLYMLSQNIPGTTKLMNQMVADGEATTEQVSDVMFQIKAVNNQMSGIPSSVSSETQLESAIILQEIADLQNRKKNMDEAFHENIDIRIKAKKEDLAEIVKPEFNKSKSRKGAKKAAKQLNSTFETFDSEEKIAARVKQIEAEGGKTQDSTGYGQSIIDKDGNKIILINDQAAAEDNNYTKDQHEILHPFWQATFEGNPELAIRFGKSLMAEIINNPDINAGTEMIQRFSKYLSDPKYSAANTWEEVIPLVSEALSRKDIVYSPKQEGFWASLGTKISNVFKDPLNKQKLNIKFNSGKDVFEFIKDYTKTIESGKGLNKGQLKVAKEGAKGALVEGDVEVDGKGAEVVALLDSDMKDETDADSSDAKASQRTLTPEQDKSSGETINEIKALEKEGKAIAKKFGKPFQKGAKQVRLENELTASIKPLVEKVVTNRTKALYDPIAGDAKRNVTRQEFQDSMRSDLQTMAISEYNGTQELEKFIVNRGFLRANSLAQRLGIKPVEEGITQGMEAAADVAAEDTTVAKETKDTSSKIKPSSFISNQAVAKIKEQVQEKIKGIDPKNLTFKKLGDLAPEIIAQELGIPVKKLTSPTANLSKGDATAIQQFVNKNADKLLKILPEGAVVEAATDKLLGTSTGVPKGLLNAFYTKQARLGKGAGLAPFKLNKGISKADFLETFGIVEGKKAEGFDARSPQAQALKGIAGLYGKLVTNEIVRSDTDLSLEAKQDVAAGKNKSMASKRIDTEAEMSPDLKKLFEEVSVLKNKKQLASELDFNSPPINESNRVAQQEEMQEAVVNHKLDTATIEAGMMGSGGKQTFYGVKGGKMYSSGKQAFDAGIKNPVKFGKTTDGKFVEINTEGITNWVAKPGRLYYGNEDPAYKKLIESAQVYNGPKTKRITPHRAFSKNPKTRADAKQESENNMEVLTHVVTQLSNAVADGMSLDIAAAIIIQSYQATSGLVKISAPFKYRSTFFRYGGPKSKKQQREGNKYREEHNPPASVVGASIVLAIKNNAAIPTMKAIKENYYQTQLSKFDDDLLDQAKLDSTLVEGQNIFNDPITRLAAAGIDLNTIENPDTGKTVAEESGFGINPGVYSKYSVDEKLQASSIQNEAILEGLKNPDLDVASQIKASLPLVPGKSMASKRDSDLIPDAIKYDRPITVQTAINALEKTDKALELARKLDQPVKKIRVFDFDDTLARTKSNVLYTMPDGTTGAIDAATFAKEAGNMEAEGAQWDFSEFSKVMQGSKGPLLDVAKIIADKRGTKDVFVLTARPANAAGPIKEFLASMGLDIPLANITGLGDGAPAAKAGWIMGKAAEGYNDFYFADDHTGNVKAVKDVLSQIDVKSKVQLAKASKRTTFDTVVNDMIEDSSGIETYKKYSAARAQTVGASKGKYNFLIPPSAEDFTGLLYKMIGKGKKGDAQMAFLKTNLLDPYNRAESAVTQAKVSAANDFKALKNKLKTLPKTLSKQTGIGKFTYSHAVRVAAWTKQGMDIPGLSKRDVKELVDFVNNDAKLRVFTDELINIQKGKEYPKPGKTWLGGNITTDIIGGINKVNRAEYQQEWRENLDIIFSEDNMNKMEAAYGTRWREAMEDSIRRMKSGSNRPIGGNRVTEGLLNWLNNSVGAVMFLNTRSALLQTISAVNFINLSDNNIVKAGVAFANQKQFWGDFMTLMNSDYLVERRNGLKINVSESEIADAVREAQNKPKAAIAFLLSKGFVMTRFADSFAIASGGSTFYRNRLKSLLKGGMDQKAAEAQAFADFKAIAEESQQSSSPSKISQQQASAAGRVILAWANTPMQYARIQKRAGQDLINGRGDWKTNISKIAYYGAVQNLIFNTLQNAVFALGFGDDDEEDEVKAKKKEEKAYKVANGMIDSQLKGLGIFGAASVAMKNTLMTLYKEHNKKGSKYENAVADLEGFSPPLGSKIGKITGGLRSASWNKKDMKEKGFSLDNPAYMAGAQVLTGLTNIPFDRVMKKINNIRGIVNERSALWQKVALGLGWGTYELGLGYYGGFDKEEPLTPKQQLKLEVDTMKKDTNKPDQVKTLLDFGLTKKQIRELKNENNRVKKILELQKNKK